MRFDAVLFDLDGTLIDTAPDMARALNLLCKERGHAQHPVSAVRPYVSRGAVGVLDACLGDACAENVARFLEIYAEGLAIDSALFPGMSRVLATIEKSGAPWGVVTNKAERLATGVMSGLGLLERCAVLVGGDTTAHRKPHPLPLLTACRAIDVTPDAALYVGDDERDIVAGREAGMATASAQWGYLPPGTDIRTWNADFLCASPADLREQLQLAA